MSILLKLCSRAIRFPQLLELSGIGDSRLLSSVGVDAIVDLLGVGTKLQEHVYGGIVYGKRLTHHLGIV